MSDSFGGRLRVERERQQLTLSAVASQTKINIHLLQGLERDDLSRWPTGIFRRSFLRVYADALGLDPEPLLREFLVRFPDPTEPQSARPTPGGSSPLGPSPLRLTLAESACSAGRGRPLLRVGARWAAAGWDLATVLGIALGLFAVSGTFWLPLALGSIVYYAGSILVLGKTPGVRLFGPDGQRSRPLPATAAIPPHTQAIPPHSQKEEVAGEGSANVVRPGRPREAMAPPRRVDRYRVLTMDRASVAPREEWEGVPEGYAVPPARLGGDHPT
jgi:hypothetical protein